MTSSSNLDTSDIRHLLERSRAGDGAARDVLARAVMARLEAMEPHRAALIAIAQARGMLVIAPHLPRTTRALLEAAGIDTGGPWGALRIAGLTSAWARILQVWRDDQGALNRTMAEIDLETKLSLSHRGRAFEALLPLLQR